VVGQGCACLSGEPIAAARGGVRDDDRTLDYGRHVCENKKLIWLGWRMKVM
jgi:hypothetical protein